VRIIKSFSQRYHMSDWFCTTYTRYQEDIFGKYRCGR